MRRHANIIDFPRLASSVAVAVVLAFLGAVLLRWIESPALWFYVFGSIVVLACLRQAFAGVLSKVAKREERRMLDEPAWSRRRLHEVADLAVESRYSAPRAALFWIASGLAVSVLLAFGFAAAWLSPHLDVDSQSLLLAVFEIFLFVVWVWILFTIIGDLFRDHKMSGWAKAAWIIFLVFIPYISMLVYLIARGSGMRERTLQAQSEVKYHFDSYVQEQADTSPADELHKLNDLKEKGALSAEEFDRAKKKLFSEDPGRRTVP